MAPGLPQGVMPGQIYRHSRFYRDAGGRWQAKYLVVLTAANGGDIVFRLLTSQTTGRLEIPSCHHGDPYPGFFLGVLGPPLSKKSWLDLRGQNDYDGVAFNQHLKDEQIKLILTLRSDVLCAALECTANAQDTTQLQERALRDQRTRLRC